jgi:AraC-like DNA-binding protein
MSSPEYLALDRAVRAYLAFCYAHGTAPHVGEFAALVGMSRSAFCRYFKRVCGEPPSVVLRRALVQHANRLRESGTSVTKSARATGVTPRTIYRLFQASRHAHDAST